MKTRGWRFWLPVVLLAAACLYLGGATFVVWRFTNTLLSPGALTAALQSGPVVTDPLQLGYRGDPMLAFGLPFENTTIDTPLGPAPAWFVPSAPDAPVAIYIHGIAGAREDGYRHLALLHDAGYAVLLITYRNDAEAPADPAGYSFGLTEWADLDAAVAWLAAQYPERHILLVGESMGGAIVGQFLRYSPLANRITAVALDAPAIDVPAVITHIAGQTGLPLPSIIGRSTLALLSATRSQTLRDAAVSDVFAAFDGPLFIAHGAGDRIVPITPAQALVAARTPGSTVSFWTEADHLQSYAADPAAYTAAFQRFLALVPRP
jgi:uncharacterized protein